MTEEAEFQTEDQPHEPDADGACCCGAVSTGGGLEGLTFVTLGGGAGELEREGLEEATGVAGLKDFKLDLEVDRLISVEGRGTGVELRLVKSSKKSRASSAVPLLGCGPA
jgi:hypothetical protein